MDVGDVIKTDLDNGEYVESVALFIRNESNLINHNS